MASIILTTLNARYSHASLGLRYLLANMGPLQPDTHLVEFTLDRRPIDIVEQLLQLRPSIVGFGVYIWNTEETTKVVALLKRIAPEVTVVLGGPEVSYEPDEQEIVRLADYVITGQADLAFAELCSRLLSGNRPDEKVLKAGEVSLSELVLPYGLYTDEDVAHRTIYVEASRGCPFKCEFCLSSLDKTVSPFDLDRFLDEMRTLYDRGVRQFKFVDRTFNLKAETSIRILAFFLERLDDRLFVHFEVIPDRLPDSLKEIIKRFPPGALQFEIGIQTFNPVVQDLISRRQDNRKTEENLVWFNTQTNAHLHTDLIVGLPGEDMQSFGDGFDRLVSLGPHEIQVGILKRLRGTPIIRHTDAFDMRYNPLPPYNVLSTNCIDFAAMQRLSRFARYWDMIGNSGRFQRARPLILGGSPFRRFMQLSDWLFATTGKTHQIAIDRLFELVYEALTTDLGVPAESARNALTHDYLESGFRSAPSFIAPEMLKKSRDQHTTRAVSNAPERQARHIRG